MIHHDLRLVRMHELDGTLHCEVHGLLDLDESIDVYARAELDPLKLEMANIRAKGWPWSWVARVLDWSAQATGPVCVADD